MTEKLFPTFSRWLRNLVDTRQGMWHLRGPTWYISTWIGDSLATQQRSLLHVLAVAQKEKLELAPLIECFAVEHRAGYRRLLKRLAQRLRSGVALVDALEQTPDVLDDDAVLALRFGSQSGTTQAVFDMLLSRDFPSETDPGRTTSQVWAYWVVLACSIAFLLLIMMTLIAPTFKKMFEEFGLRLPGSLQVLIAICDGFAKYIALWILLGVVVVGLFWSSAARRLFRRKLAPIFVQPVVQLRKAELLKLLAVGVDSGATDRRLFIHAGSLPL